MLKYKLKHILLCLGCGF